LNRIVVWYSVTHRHRVRMMPTTPSHWPYLSFALHIRIQLSSARACDRKANFNTFRLSLRKCAFTLNRPYLAAFALLVTSASHRSIGSSLSSGTATRAQHGCEQLTIRDVPDRRTYVAWRIQFLRSTRADILSQRPASSSAFYSRRFHMTTMSSGPHPLRRRTRAS